MLALPDSLVHNLPRLAPSRRHYQPLHTHNAQCSAPNVQYSTAAVWYVVLHGPELTAASGRDGFQTVCAAWLADRDPPVCALKDPSPSPLALDRADTAGI